MQLCADSMFQAEKNIQCEGPKMEVYLGCSWIVRSVWWEQSGRVTMSWTWILF